MKMRLHYQILPADPRNFLTPQIQKQSTEEYCTGQRDGSRINGSMTFQEHKAQL